MLELVALAAIVYCCFALFYGKILTDYLPEGPTSNNSLIACSQSACSAKDPPGYVSQPMPIYADVSAADLRNRVSEMLVEIQKSAVYQKFINKKMGIDIADGKIVYMFTGCMFAFSTLLLLIVGISTALLSEILLHYLVVFLVITVVTMFGLLGIFEARDLIAIYSAIAGYILGQSNRRSSCSINDASNFAAKP